MAQRQRSDPSAALARVQSSFKGGFTGVTDALQKRRENTQRLRELILQGRLDREKQAADPEFQAKQAALQAINQVAPLPELRMRQGIDSSSASRLQELFRDRTTERLGERAKLSEMFGLTPRATQGGVTQVFGVNRETGQMESIGEVPKGSRVIPEPVETLEKKTARQSAITAQRNIQNIRKLVLTEEGGNPQLFFSFGLPGIEGSRDLAKAFSRLELEIVTARGGKQLTPSERQLVKSVFPNIVDAADAMARKDESIIKQSLDELDLIAQGLIGELDPSVIQQQLQERRQQVQVTQQNAEAVKARLRQKYGR